MDSIFPERDHNLIFQGVVKSQGWK